MLLRTAMNLLFNFFTNIYLFHPDNDFPRKIYLVKNDKCKTAPWGSPPQLRLHGIPTGKNLVKVI